MHYISYWRGRNDIVFMGDKRMRNLFDEFVALVHGDGEPDSPQIQAHILKPRNIYKAPLTNMTVPVTVPVPIENYEDLNEVYEQGPIGLQAVSVGQCPHKHIYQLSTLQSP